jgi:hypothetical protein
MRWIVLGILAICTLIVIAIVIHGLFLPVEYDPDDWENVEEYNEYLDDHNSLRLTLWAIKNVCILIMIWTLALFLLETYKETPAKVDIETLRRFEAAEEAAEGKADELGIDVDMAMVIATCHQEGLSKFQIAEYYKISLADVNAGIDLHRERLEELAIQRDPHDL